MMPGGRIIGVDVGGTKMSIAWWEDGAFSTPELRPTLVDDGADALLDELVAGIEAARGDDARAVGVGLPSVIEWETGRVRSSVNIPLRDVPLRQVLGERLGLPVYVDNDATVAALAEAHDGERFVHRDLVMFTVGTGVGGGLVLGGRIYRGFTGAAAELGHTLIGAALEDGAPPAAERFPQPGSLEALAAGSELDRLAAAELGPEADGIQVVDAAHAGDEDAIGLVRVLGERLGIGIANAINTFDPEVVVIGGGVARAGDLLLAPAEAVARRFVVPGSGTRTEIRLARHGTEAGVRGAALLAAQELRS
jgi:glucokinase